MRFQVICKNNASNIVYKLQLFIQMFQMSSKLYHAYYMNDVIRLVASCGNIDWERNALIYWLSAIQYVNSIGDKLHLSAADIVKHCQSKVGLIVESVTVAAVWSELLVLEIRVTVLNFRTVLLVTIFDSICRQ